MWRFDEDSISFQIYVPGSRTLLPAMIGSLMVTLVLLSHSSAFTPGMNVRARKPAHAAAKNTFFELIDWSTPPIFVFFATPVSARSRTAAPLICRDYD